MLVLMFLNSYEYKLHFCKEQFLICLCARANITRFKIYIVCMLIPLIVYLHKQTQIKHQFLVYP